MGVTERRPYFLIEHFYCLGHIDPIRIDCITSRRVVGFVHRLDLQSILGFRADPSPRKPPTAGRSARDTSTGIGRVPNGLCWILRGKGCDSDTSAGFGSLFQVYGSSRIQFWAVPVIFLASGGLADCLSARANRNPIAGCGLLVFTIQQRQHFLRRGPPTNVARLCPTPVFPHISDLRARRKGCRDTPISFGRITRERGKEHGANIRTFDTTEEPSTHCGKIILLESFYHTSIKSLLLLAKCSIILPCFESL